MNLDLVFKEKNHHRIILVSAQVIGPRMMGLTINILWGTYWLINISASIHFKVVQGSHQVVQF